jgi:hypothetical protein
MAVMMRNRRHYRKPDSRLLLAVVVTLAAFMTTAVKAEELINYTPADPGTRLMSLFMEEGYQHDPAKPASRLQVSFVPPPVATAASGTGRGSAKPSHILFSWHIRW